MTWAPVVVALVIGCKSAHDSSRPAVTSAAAGSAAPTMAPGGPVQAVGCKPGPRAALGFRIEQDTPLPEGRAVAKLGRLGDGRLVAKSHARERERGLLFIREGAQWNRIEVPPAVLPFGYDVEITSTAIVITHVITIEHDDPKPHVWVWNPKSRSWSDAGERELHGGDAVALADGTVMLAGGYIPRRGRGGDYADTAVIVSETGMRPTAGLPGRSHYREQLTLLRDGRLLRTGGETREVHVWSPKTATWTATGSLARVRHGHDATELPDGRVLVIGGSEDERAIAEIEEWNPSSGTWRDVGRLGEPRLWPTATVLADCRVVVAGGSVPFTTPPGEDLQYPLALTTEIWNAVDQRLEQPLFEPTGAPDHKTWDEKTKAFVDVPASVGAVFDPTDNEWGYTPDPFGAAKPDQSAVLLADGNVLITGGTESHIYETATAKFLPAGAFSVARGKHALARLPDGRVLAIGGESDNTSPRVEVFDPTTKTWSVVGSVPAIWTAPHVHVLGDKRVLVVPDDNRAFVLTLE